MSDKIQLDLDGLVVDRIEVLPADSIEFLTTGHGMTENAASFRCFCGGGSCLALPSDEV